MILGVAAPVQAQRGPALRNSPAVLDAFREVVARPSESTVRVLCDDDQVALGVVVGEDGWIITKASELKGKVVCKLKDGRTFPRRSLGVEDKHDLAMLKIEAKGLKPIEWRESKSAAVGNWLVSPGTASPWPLAWSAWRRGSRTRRDMPTPRRPSNAGYLGIRLDEGDGGRRSSTSSPSSPAAKAGLKVGDVVLKVAGRLVKNPENLVAAIQGFTAGKTITLQIKRGEEVKELKATLDKRPADQGNRAEMQNNMGSKLSEQRGGFPVILQHDQVIAPTDCGGPLVDLDGKAVGVNIARAGRVESYAIPSESVQALIPVLKSGKLAPKGKTVVAATVEELEKAVAKAKADVKRDGAALQAADEDADNRALEAQLAAAKKKLAEAQTALDRAKKDPTKK